jgi:RNA polymerase sigma-70 factor (ECF subfamily)
MAPPSPDPETQRRSGPKAGRTRVSRGPTEGANEGLTDEDAGGDADFRVVTQPEGESGVTEDGPADAQAGEDAAGDDMATLALNPNSIAGTFTQLPAPDSLRNNGDFAGMEDAEIMLQLSGGNMAAFDFLLAKYRRPIVHFMYRMVRNEAVAEELAQEVFLRVYRSRETYRAEARFSTWLYRIATNLGVNHARDTRHERAASTVYLDEPDSESGSTPDVADLTPGAEANILRRERMAAIREHVMALPERQRMAVLMHKYEGMDYKQIGDVLKLSESATKSLLFRAYQTLREKLKPFI